MNEEEKKDLEINTLKEKLEIAQEIMNQIEKMITKIELAMIKHKISHQKTLEEINKVTSWFKDPYENNKIPTTEFDIETEQMNKTLQEIQEQHNINKSKILGIIDALDKILGKNIPLENIETEAKKQGITQEETTEILEKLKKQGYIFNPKHGIINKIE